MIEVTRDPKDNFGCYYWLLREDARVQPRHKLLFPLLGSYGEVFRASVATIAEDSGHSQNFCREALADLVAAGWLEVLSKKKGKPVKYALKGPASIRDLTPSKQIPLQTGYHHPFNSDTTTPSKQIPEADKTNRERQADKTDPLFDIFWKAYPRKQDKPNALKAWQSLKADETLLSYIMQDLAERAQDKDWTKDSFKFVPYACRYLKNRRWEDERPTTTRKRMPSEAM